MVKGKEMLSQQAKRVEARDQMTNVILTVGASNLVPRVLSLPTLRLEKVPWLRLVTCLCIQIKAALGVGLRLNCVKTVYGGESCFASQTLF